ncbi:MAG TPA: hypothetical protein VJ775_02770 [Sphingomicrobium sp.]|nr:hypothetical protein [Sphingomicrobium sp.]
MLKTNHRAHLRRVALFVAIPWFLYWGHSAYVSLEARDAAETAWLAADSRRDWASAAAHEQEKREAAQDLVRSVAWGFFLPLALLVAAEIDMGIRQAARRGR